MEEEETLSDEFEIKNLQEQQNSLVIADESSQDNIISEDFNNTNLEKEHTQINNGLNQMDQPTTSIRNEEGNATTSIDIIGCAPLQTLASGLAFARIADLSVQKDEHVLRCHGFKSIFIPCERLETVYQRDRKYIQLRQIKEVKEKKVAKKERRRKNKEAYRDDSDRDEREKKKRKKEKHSSDQKRKYSPPNIYAGRDEVARSLQKHNFAAIVQCCVCESVVDKERFGGRDTLFCSQKCISKKAEDARKCVKEGERILVIDHKGAMMNHSHLNPTIETLEDFLLANPSYQPVLASEQIVETNHRLHDPAYQKKIESMRVDVRKAIETNLQKRSKSANMIFSLKRYKDLGMEIERSLFSIHQDVNLGYRKWFKSFITVVNDEMNGFFRDVLRDKVSVKKLVTLSIDQMSVPLPQNEANTLFFAGHAPSTSSNFIVAAADSTSISETPEENVYNEPCTSVSKTTQIRKKIITTASRHNMVKKAPLQAKSTLDDILGDLNKDTTHLHNSHLYDANCGICKQMNLKKFAEKERQERLEAELEQRRRAEEVISGQVNFPDLDPSIQAAMLEVRADETASNGWDILKQRRSGQFDMLECSASSPTINNDNNNILLDGDVIFGRCDNPFDQERHLRDPLGLELVDALPPEQICENNHEDDNMSFEGGENDYGNDDAFNGGFNNYAPEISSQLAPEVQDTNVDFRSTQNDYHQFNQSEKPREDEVSCISPFEQINNNIEMTIENNENWNSFNGSMLHPINGQMIIDEQEFNRGKRFNNQIWKGKFIWTNLASFDCTLSAISNKGAFKVGRELPPVLHVMGRSEAIGVWKYIDRLKDNYQYEFYTRFYEKVNYDNKQIIVLDLTGHDRIKDGYIFTLAPGKPLPSILFPFDGPGLPEWCGRRGCMIIMLVRRMDREDKLLLKRLDENCRPPTLQPRNIPTERVDLLSSPAERQQQSRLLDPRLDKNLTRHSKCYRPHHLFREMPHLFDDIIAQFSSGDEEGLEEGELLQ
ncbi:unnamed protein product [Meloidogyne enterolobii]|uniref:Uncharacterized protein n=1 Tax=Meloidogyne enterolobii TaxID=390850 RepID=A0ACB1AMS9_MELEN